MTAGRIVVVGSVNADLVVHVDRHPEPGETVLGADAHRYPGGKGANQAVAAARLGADVAFAGKVGADAEGEMLTAALRDAGASVTALAVDDAKPSGVALIVVDHAGENTIVVSPGANHAVQPAGVDAAFDALAPISLVVLQCELLPQTVAHAVLAAAARGARVVVNLAPPTPLERTALALADPIIVNEHEAAYLLDSQPGGLAAAALDDAAATLARLRELGPPSAVITLGDGGAIAADARGASNHAAARVEVADTTGAGDAFTGALATRLAEGADVHEATRFAVLVGTEAVRAPGAQGSFPRRADVTAK